MTYPQPKYKDNIDIGSLVYKLNNQSFDGKYQQRFNAAYHAVLEYVNNSLYRFQTNAEDKTGQVELKQFAATSPEDITVKFSAETKMDGESHSSRIPLNLVVYLHSFKTPVDSLKQKLIDIVKSACED